MKAGTEDGIQKMLLFDNTKNETINTINTFEDDNIVDNSIGNNM